MCAGLLFPWPWQDSACGGCGLVLEPEVRDQLLNPVEVTLQRAVQDGIVHVRVQVLLLPVL